MPILYEGGHLHEGGHLNLDSAVYEYFHTVGGPV